MGAAFLVTFVTLCGGIEGIWWAVSHSKIGEARITEGVPIFDSPINKNDGGTVPKKTGFGRSDGFAGFK